MSSIVYANKSLALATGLRWSVLNAAPSKAGAATRIAGRSVGATKFVVDRYAEQNYLGLYTPGVSIADVSNAKRRKIHSLALVFVEAVLRSSEIERSMLYAILAVSQQDGSQSTTANTALVIIDGGRIIYDGLESFARATEIINDHRSRDGRFQLFSDSEDFVDANIINWASLIEYAGSSNITKNIPRNPAQYFVLLAVILGIGGYGTYYQLVTLPAKRAEEARKRAEADRTPIYLKALEEAMQNAGWSVPSMVSHIKNLDASTYFYQGWVLKSMDCNVNACTEVWDRLGGSVTDLMQMRNGGQYIPEKSIPDKTATVQMPLKAEGAKLTHEMIPAKGIDVHKAIKPPLNKIENAGGAGQLGETMTWPVMPMTGVRSDVVIKRTRLEINYKYPFAIETLNEMPANFVPESFLLSSGQEMSISLKGFVYEK